MIIDIHNHMYPQPYVEALQAEPSAYRISFDDHGNPILHSPGDYNILVPSHRLAEIRQQVVVQAGLTKQVVTLTAPGTTIEPPARSVRLSQLINDAFAQIQHDHSDRLAALATLPLNDPAAALLELERAVKQLGLKGAMIFSNANGTPLSDQRFWPLYEKAHELKAILHLHPTFPVGVEAMQDFMLMPLVGFLADTTLAVSGLIYSGVIERFPGIRWILSHLGGAVLYLAERLDRGYEAFQQCRAHINRPPSEYLKTFYYDTVNFDPQAIQFAIDFAGVDHLLAGSDYPHQIGSIDKMIASINALKIDQTAKAAILGGNAARLFG